MAAAVTKKSVAVLHAGGYAGRELTLLLLRHPFARVATVTSRTFAGAPVHAAHPSLRGLTEMQFVDPDALNVSGTDAILLTAEHGKAALTVLQILRGGFEGPIVDLSADFRFSTGENYESTIGVAHPAPGSAAKVRLWPGGSMRTLPGPADIQSRLLRHRHRTFAVAAEPHGGAVSGQDHGPYRGLGCRYAPKNRHTFSYAGRKRARLPNTGASTPARGPSNPGLERGYRVCPGIRPVDPGHMGNGPHNASRDRFGE